MPLIGGCRCWGAAEPKAGNSAEDDGADLSDRGRAQQDDQCCDHGDRSALAIGTERARHAPHRLGHDRDGHQLEPVKQTRPDFPLEGARAIGEEHKRDRRRQRESNPCREAAKITGAHETKREPDLAACRPRQELAQRHQIGVSLLAEPAPFDDELLPEIADVRDWAAEAAYAELRESAQNLERGPGSLMIFDRHAGRHSVHRDATNGAFARI
jgi:hypothetical protein